MKYNLHIKYANQEVTFKDLEVDDEILLDGSDPLSGTVNNETVINNFFENFQILVEWEKEEI